MQREIPLLGCMTRPMRMHDKREIALSRLDELDRAA